MATKVNESSLTCSICLLRFRKPRALPCLHSYCEECLVDYAPKGSQDLLCPLCQDKIQIPDGDVTKFKLDFRLQNMVEDANRYEKEAGIVSDVRVCNCCKDEGEALAKCRECGQLLCKFGVKAHESLAVFGDHSVTPLIDDDSDDDSNSIVQVSNYEGISDEMLEMYFENSRRSGGGEIVSLDHDQEHGGSLTIRFRHSEDAQSVLSKRVHLLAGINLTVLAGKKKNPVDPTCIFLSGVPDNVNNELLCLYLENCTGKEETPTITYGEIHGTAMVAYTSAIEIVHRVLTRKHYVCNTAITVSKYHDCLMASKGELIDGRFGHPRGTTILSVAGKRTSASALPEHPQTLKQVSLDHAFASRWHEEKERPADKRVTHHKIYPNQEKTGSWEVNLPSQLQPAKHITTMTHQATSSASPTPLPAFFKTSNGIDIVIDNGDITQARVDIIVNSSNKRLQHGRGVAGALSKAAGRELQQACNKIMSNRPVPLKTGECVLTDGYNLECRILHTVGPVYMDYSSDNEFHRVLKDTLVTAMRYANLPAQAKSIAIPLVSSGIFGGSKEICAAALLEAVHEFNLQRYPVIKTIVLINLDPEATQAIYKAFARRYSASADDLRESISSFESMSVDRIALQYLMTIHDAELDKIKKDYNVILEEGDCADAYQGIVFIKPAKKKYTFKELEKAKEKFIDLYQRMFFSLKRARLKCPGVPKEVISQACKTIKDMHANVCFFEGTTSDEIIVCAEESIADYVIRSFRNHTGLSAKTKAVEKRTR